ncbi:arylamine N-acetyltransferase [Nocardioides sp. cx-169]|uniref:arylamine N-acetyltransferase family protein n=1 Tax=Nocardioides sp. cx-169 TaxID=2899080 RepID=UPI001E6492BB|nr:arylamine N-acetyltransferase [Nocardioides sp. cx-169]MCD4534702.1 arylamine N-acetyltransferase [Nocardioides sp. cx-169]
MPIRAYLGRLGVDQALPPTLESLRLLHRRHLEHVPYENLGIMLGQGPSVDPDSSLQRVVDHGRAGYCLHQNAVLELVLTSLGFTVERRHGHVWTHEESRDETFLNHLALVVSGLPTPDNPDGLWWPDVGLGEGFWEPLPLVVGEYDDGPFRFAITEVRPDGWSFRNDPSGSFVGLEVTDRATHPAAVLAAHAVLSTPPDGAFTRILVVQRRDEAGGDTLRGCVATRQDGDGQHQRDLITYDAWVGELLRLGVSLDGFAEQDLRALFDRTLAAHEGWVAAGRP